MSQSDNTVKSANAINFWGDASKIPPLDPSLYPLDKDPESLKFFQDHTKIEDQTELKKHILDIQVKAYNIFGYPCIRVFYFLKPRIQENPAYLPALSILKKNPKAIILDIGCNFGTDLRKAIYDGWPANQAIGSDLETGFWNCGLELFKSTPENFPAGFAGGDVFDPNLIQPRAVFKTGEKVEGETPSDLTPLKSLTPLQGRISAIHAGLFFHLFSEEKQLEAARQVGSLLSPEPGSTIFGCHVAQPQKRFVSKRSDQGEEFSMFCHSPETWRDEVWDGPVFEKGTVEVKAEIVQSVASLGHLMKGTSTEALNVQYMMWSVTRK